MSPEGVRRPMAPERDGEDGSDAGAARGATPRVPDDGTSQSGVADNANANPADAAHSTPGTSDAGTYRVLASPRADDEVLLVAPGTGERTYVAGDGYAGALAGTVAGLEPGNRVRAAVDWTGERPRLASLTVESRTRFAFARDVTDLFEAAAECWQDARAAGEPMDSRVTRDADGDPNGVLYVFAEQPGERDLFAEFREGRRPLDPLAERVEGADPPYEVFVLDPREHRCVVVYIALEREGLLAETVRDTYL